MSLRATCVPGAGRVSLIIALGLLAICTVTALILAPNSAAQRGLMQTLSKAGTSTIGQCDSAVLDVEANGLSTPYTSLAAAFLDINNGVHTGEIVIEACGDTAHAGSAVINSSGAGSANYSHITLRPLGDGVRITGTPVAGKGVIELNGADNITVDGDNPLTPGTNRDLTIENAGSETLLHTQVIRIAMNTSGHALTATGNAIRNLNLIGNVRSGNVGSITSNSSSASVTYGILAAGGGSDTVAPSAISGATPSIGGTATAANLTIQNNSIRSVGRGISLNGNADNVFGELNILGNDIGNPTTGETDQVYAIGVAVRGSTDALIEGNNLWIESYLVFSPLGGIRALDHGFLLSSNTGVGFGTRFEKNKIYRVKNNNPATQAITGIALSRGSGHQVINNFVMGVMNRNVTGNGFTSTGATAGIRTITAGIDFKILHNSVHLTGTVDGTGGAMMTAALALWNANLNSDRTEIRNNIFSNQISGGHPDSRHVAVYLPSGMSTSYRVLLDNNAYFQGTAPNSRLAQVGTTVGSGSYDAANFSSTERSNGLNFRAYTYNLIPSSIHHNDSGSFAAVGAPPFVSDTDLHLVPASGFQVEAGGADVGVAADIDGHPRDGSPEIGADELFAPTAAGVMLAGRVTGAGGRGIYGARVAFTAPGGTVYAITNPFGYYRFTNVLAGSSAVISVSAKGCKFATPSRMITVEGDLFGIDFIAEQ